MKLHKTCTEEEKRCHFTWNK